MRMLCACSLHIAHLDVFFFVFHEFVLYVFCIFAFPAHTYIHFDLFTDVQIVKALSSIAAVIIVSVTYMRVFTQSDALDCQCKDYEENK